MAKAKTTQTKKKKEETLSLEQVLFNCRSALRGYGNIEKNRDAIISLVFLKSSSDSFMEVRQQIMKEYPGNKVYLESPCFYNADNVFYLNETTRWDYIQANAGASNIALILDKAMKDIMACNKRQLSGALQSNLFVNFGVPKEKLKSLIDEISKIDKKNFDDTDLIGRVYEYFLKAYAASASKDDGEFYTPACVVQLIAELIEPYNGTVYDPCCGSGGMFVQSKKFVEKHQGNFKNISIIAQESQEETWRLAKLNLAGRHIAHNLGKKNASTFTDDQHVGKKAQYIMANPPFNLKDWRGKDELVDDYRFKPFGNPPPVSNANYAWILHMLSKLDSTDGIAGFLLANGALKPDGVEIDIACQLVEKDKIEAIIVLPRDMFYTTDISVTLWILNQNKDYNVVNNRSLRDRRGEILFMDLRTWNQNIDTIQIDKGKQKKKVVLTDEQITKIRDIYFDWQSYDTKQYHDVPELCRSVKTSEIIKIVKDENGKEYKTCCLAPSKYIEFIDHDLEIDFPKEMARIQKEMADIITKEKASQKKLEAAFVGIGYGIN